MADGFRDEDGVWHETDAFRNRLGLAFHMLASHGGPLTPCGYVDYEKGEYIKVGYKQNPPEDEFACMCESIAAGIIGYLDV